MGIQVLWEAPSGWVRSVVRRLLHHRTDKKTIIASPPPNQEQDSVTHDEMLHPILRHSKEQELLLAAQSGDVAARQQVLRDNARLVEAVAKRYQGFGLPNERLIQEGTGGLDRSIDRYDPRRGLRFSTFASKWIRQAITRALVHHDHFLRTHPGLSKHSES